LLKAAFRRSFGEAPASVARVFPRGEGKRACLAFNYFGRRKTSEKMKGLFILTGIKKSSSLKNKPRLKSAGPAVYTVKTNFMK
jgi:hypothetical protein